MFTGLVEEIGSIKRFERQGNGYLLEIGCHKIMDDVKVDDSIAVNGTCLTVTTFTKDSFTVQAVAETVQRTTMSGLKIGSRVNLERALRLSDRLGGHLVQGHIDAIAEVIRVTPGQLSTDFVLAVDAAAMRYIVAKGSVALDGISLTVAEVNGNTLRVSIIPHTIKSTIISSWQSGSKVNLETDIIGRYIENFVGGKSGGLTMEKLRDLGY